jgi:hypothetical protein
MLFDGMKNGFGGMDLTQMVVIDRRDGLPLYPKGHTS